MFSLSNKNHFNKSRGRQLVFRVVGEFDIPLKSEYNGGGLIFPLD